MQISAEGFHLGSQINPEACMAKQIIARRQFFDFLFEVLTSKSKSISGSQPRGIKKLSS